MKTSTVKPTAAIWYIVDATGQTIGNVATNVAHVLRGKNKPTFSPHHIGGDHVIVINVDKLSIAPKKSMNKLYYDHTGYLGHMQVRTLEKMMENHPERVIERAVKGMLPQNRLRPLMLKHLHVYVGSEHKYAAQKPVPLALSL
jgi:large subunit ribosomal protein L13